MTKTKTFTHVNARNSFEVHQVEPHTDIKSSCGVPSRLYCTLQLIPPATAMLGPVFME